MCPQLLAGATTEEKTAWRLGPPADFCYTNQSGCDTVAGMSDAAELVATRNAFGTLGVGDSVQEPVFRVIAAILHLGNVIFSGGEGESMTQVENEEQVRAATPAARGVVPPLTCFPPLAVHAVQLAFAASLLQVGAAELGGSLRTKTIGAGGSIISVPLDRVHAESARDTLSKAIYSRLFDHLIRMINQSLQVHTHDGGMGEVITFAAR